MVDRGGVPLAVIRNTAANVPHGSRISEEILDAVEPIRKPRGRPRKGPKKPHADEGYGYPWRRKALGKRDNPPRIARRGVE